MHARTRQDAEEVVRGERRQADARPDAGGGEARPLLLVPDQGLHLLQQRVQVLGLGCLGGVVGVVCVSVVVGGMGGGLEKKNADRSDDDKQRPT